MSYAVVQGSSKGIGLAISRYLLNNTKMNVVGTTSSDPSKARASILESADKDAEGRLTTLAMDVTNESSIAQASKTLNDKFGTNMRLLVNISGVLHAERSLKEVDLAELTKTFQVNTFGHLLVYKHFVSLIPDRKKKHDDHPSKESIFEADEGFEGADASNGILPVDKSTLVSFSARVGSIGESKSGGWYSYRSSKAATNQIIRILSHELTMRKLPGTAFAYHPGTVKTGLSEAYVGGKKADPSKGLFEPEMAAEKFVEVLKSRVENGKFVDWKAEEVPW